MDRKSTSQPMPELWKDFWANVLFLLTILGFFMTMWGLAALIQHVWQWVVA